MTVVKNDPVATLLGLGVRSAFSKLSNGNMSLKFGQKEEVERNPNYFYSAAGFNKRRRIHICPEHGDKIKIVGEKEIGKNIKCDGLITQKPNIVLSLASADCYPVVLTDKQRRFVALIHAGRKGTELEIVHKAVNLIRKKLNVSVSEIIVSIGPGIKSCCYELNFNYVIEQQLKVAGIPLNNITTVRACTCCSKDGKGNYLFFSHHRAKTKGNEGRFVVLVSL